MPTTAESLSARLRQPAYTGENRCVPCTVVNAVIAAGLAAAVGVLVDPVAGGAALLVSAAAIYFRGYLVPGTPTLTRRYLPDRVLRLFDKSPERGTVTDVDREQALREAGAVEECTGVDDVCLTDEFRAEWRDRIDSVEERDAGRAVLADLLDVDDDALRFEDYGDAFTMYAGDRQAGTWESRAAFLADVAAAELLADRHPEWSAFRVDVRSELLGALRLFLERCPACDGPVSIGEEAVESCCRTREVVAVTCEDCGARLFEADQAAH